MPPVDRGVVRTRNRLRDERLVLRVELGVLTRRAMEVHTLRCLSHAFGHVDHSNIRNWARDRVAQSYSMARIRGIIDDMAMFADMSACFFPTIELVRQPPGYWLKNPCVIDNILETEHYSRRHRCDGCGVFITNGYKLCSTCANKQRAERADHAAQRTQRAHRQALWFLTVAKSGPLDRLVCRYPAR